MKDTNMNNQTLLNNILNSTEFEEKIHNATMTYVILSILGLLGTINILCIVLIIKQDQLKIPDKLYLNMLIANITYAIAEALIVILVYVLPYDDIQQQSTELHHVVPMYICQIISATAVTACFSALLMTGWSIYVAITTPLQFHIRFTTRRIRIFSVASWIVSLVVGLLCFTFEYIEGSLTNFNSKRLDLIQPITTVVSLIGNLIISGIMGYFMSVIYKTRRKRSEIPNNDTHSNNLSQGESNVKMFNILIMVLIVNILSAFARGIIHLLTIVGLIETQAIPKVIIILYLISPVLYVIKSPEQKLVLHKWMTGCCKQGNVRNGRSDIFYITSHNDSQVPANTNGTNNEVHVHIHETAL
ncbi:unnamed protein product [Owenia fusiformis]|uniref:Uncharacterized protein n=1 Tax=Owenia fusiformis TaxID=6347 RepID=A0A8J1Y640_OWEFU|nr:unnamed protein product [Owenia fusiformis]